MPPLPNHCTLFPDRAMGRDWSHCCQAHDLAYSLGVPTRPEADLQLARCVADATGWGWLASLMWAGVVLFGGLFWRRARKT